MQASRTIGPSESLGEIEEQITHTWTFLLACKLTTGLAPPFASLLAELGPLRAAQTQLDHAIAIEEARVGFGDDDLNVLLDETKREVLAHGGNAYDAPLYKQIFGSQAPSELRRFVMSDQLEAMRTWPAILAQTGNTPLHILGPRIIQAVLQADQILAALAAARTAEDVFAAGPRATFVQSVNAARALTFGQLLELTKSPTRGPLPDDFVDRFFRRDSTGRTPRLDDLDKAIVRHAERLARVTAQRDELVRRQSHVIQTKQEAALAAKQTLLADRKKQADEAAAEVAALEAEIARGKAK